MHSLQLYYRLLRMNQWTKALFVLLGLIYSNSYQYLTCALGAALAFCLISSAVYIYNDLQDIQEDQAHPQKCKRPLANGEVSTAMGFIIIVVLLLSGLLLGASISFALVVILTTYLVINMLYNYLFKMVPVVDVFCIASGFLLRVLAGTIGIGLPLSWWLALTATLISLLIALSKRLLEKQLDGVNKTRVVLKKYPTHLLKRLIIYSAFLAFLTYVAYIISVRSYSFSFILTLPFAALGLARFVNLSHQPQQSDDPIALICADKISLFNLSCFLLLTLWDLFKQGTGSGFF